MSSFSNHEYADIIFMYGLADGDATRARNLYQERFPSRRLPNAQVFRNTFTKLRETGNLASRRPGLHYPEHYGVNIDEEILAKFSEDPTTSIRKVASELNLTEWKVWTVVNGDGRHPFHYTPVQGLDEGDPIRRLAFCRFLLNSDIEEPSFLKRILWTDESKFDRDGITNFHNLHYWEKKNQNPHMKKQVSSQRRFSVNVWAGVIANTFLGPHYLPNNLNGHAYLSFLQNDLPVILEDMPLNIRRDMIYQNDGCPAHYARSVRDYFDNTFPNRWIGRNGPILWPARSPDLTPVDFFVWGRLKDLVYDEEIMDIAHLRRKIEAGCIIIKNEMKLRVTTTEVRRRARACVRNSGGHFEHFKRN